MNVGHALGHVDRLEEARDAYIRAYELRPDTGGLLVRYHTTFLPRMIESESSMFVTRGKLLQGIEYLNTQELQV